MTQAAVRFAGVIGDPVAHSLSPAIHNAAFAAAGVACRFEAVTVAVGEVPAVVQRMRDERWLGMSVTMPHKEAVAVAVDALDPAATALRSANTVVPQPDGRMGDLVDVEHGVGAHQGGVPASPEVAADAAEHEHGRIDRQARRDASVAVQDRLQPAHADDERRVPLE